MTVMVIVVVTSPKGLVALTVITWFDIGTVGVPDIIPVAVFNDNPVGNVEVVE